MQVVFAGGASSVGASCLAIQIAEQWIVVDAGVRVDRKADPLPDLSLLEGKDVKAIFVTHAHADHIGALPLLHQAFPTAPIYASRATSLLMEVMLADALKIMTRRAVEEMELPLYPETLVAGMLTQVRPIPVGESFTIPVLPGVSIQASRAGHIAGAVSFGFSASDGSIVVSGDISSTPQRTVAGATPPQMDRCDLLVLESTYGARLHPNRQAEEMRLAQAVAHGLAQGGHTLIPCFGLGRGQELLLVLQAAQEKGQIPEFPIYVDGLVRRVCSTYLLIPEALSPTLQRQIRKGFTPFTGPNVTFVRDERDRERILAGPPACILTSSGMLTGGPSAWYAARIASNPNASILITGYQDEESPGKRLLDLAEKKEHILMLGGTQVEVRCQVAKYNLSAHADGAELVAYAAALKPDRVALVHGDAEARAALKGLLTNTDVVLPIEGMIVDKHEKYAKRSRSTAADQSVANPVEALPQGISQGASFDYTHVEQLWKAVTQVPTLRIVTARELALVWYGEVTEEKTQEILDVFEEDYEQRYFVRQHALEEAYRVRGQYEEEPGDFLSELQGSVLLLQVAPGSSKPAICRGIEPGAAIRVQLPRGVSQERTRFPYSSILETAGPAPPETQDSNQKAAQYLFDLVKAMRRIRRGISAHSLAKSCSEEALYTLGDLCELAGLAPRSLEDRMAMAKVLYQHPGLFIQQRSVLEGEGLTLYCLAPDWHEALEEPEEVERPDQNWILSVIEQYLGTPADLYKRSVNPETGDVVLAFYFPARASTNYAEGIAAAAEETGVSITVAPHTHQGELARAAHRVLPNGLTVQGTPSIFVDRSVISLHCTGQASADEIAEAQTNFYEETGWYLELHGVTIVTTRTSAAVVDNAQEAAGAIQQRQAMRQPEMNQHEALQLTQRLLGDLSDFYKAGADPANATILLRFYFPAVAQTRYAEQLAQLEAQSGWHVRLHPTAQHQALVEMARQLLPEGITSNGTPSIHLDRETVRVYCQGTATTEAIQEAQQRFLEETGWRLELLLPGQKSETPHRASRDEALTLARKMFNPIPGFYRVGADPTKGTLWLHFHFPDTARPRYMELLVELATQTGWRVYVYPNAHEKALIAQVTRLLPESVSITGKPLVYQDTRRLSVSLSEPLSEQAIEQIQGKFIEETGWKVDVER
ncbi:MAG TPA: MBL fold metallo-hydrolase [Ktedonobacteraceae bacterium]|nr:MBL fold metallo-hydrolase [Ktedonobacteraceae bacterium]